MYRCFIAGHQDPREFETFGLALLFYAADPLRRGKPFGPAAEWDVNETGHVVLLDDGLTEAERAQVEQVARS